MYALPNSYRVIFKNFSYLTFLQLVNYILPLITFPYLLRVFGPENFGKVSYLLAITFYFGLLTDFGFNISATRKVALFKNDREQLARYYSVVTSVKLVLFLIATIIYSLLLILLSAGGFETGPYIAAYTMVAGTTFDMVWFFRGIEKVQITAAINVVAKTFFVLAVFHFIRGPADVSLYLMLNGFTYTIIAFTSAAVVFTYFSLHSTRVTLTELYNEIKDSSLLFASLFAVSIYTNLNYLLLALFAGKATVGYFSLADKIRNIVQSIVILFGQALFPASAQLFKESFRKGWSFIRPPFILLAVSMALIGSVLFFFASPIIELVAGNAYRSAVPLLKIISFLPLIVLLSNIMGHQIMLNINMKKEFLQIVSSAAVVGLLLSLLLIPLLSGIGSAVSIVAAEIFVALAMVKVLVNRLHIIDGKV